MNSSRCTLHPAFDADYCPVCGTTTPIGDRQIRTLDWHIESRQLGAHVVLNDGTTIGHLVPIGDGWVAVDAFGKRLGRSDNVTRAAVLVVESVR